MPQELQYSNSDILLAADDPGREQQQALLQRVAADEADERDWRARSAPPPAPAGAPAGAPAAQQQQPGWRPDAAPAAGGAAPAAAAAGGQGGDAKIQRAADVGRTAWHAGAGATAEGAEQTLRKVKGILNKLTPEKFERLLGQLIPLVSGHEVLQVRRGARLLPAGSKGGSACRSRRRMAGRRWRCGCMQACAQAGLLQRAWTARCRLRTALIAAAAALHVHPTATPQGTIRQVFENAVQQPTFVAMYADLCRELDAALPEFYAPGAPPCCRAAPRPLPGRAVLGSGAAGPA